MKDFINERWRAILAFNGLNDFDAIWKHEAAWFEEPNQRRGGWSGVARCELRLPEGGSAPVFLKRQENHSTPTWRHPQRGEPTFMREFRRIMDCRRRAIPTLEPVYFGTRMHEGNQQAILMTEELTGYISLEDRVQAWLRDGMPPRSERLLVIDAVARLVRQVHAHRIRHGCLFPKHVFVRINPDGSSDARVIDLEKSRRRPLRVMCAQRDLYSLSRESSTVWSRTDKLRFFERYLEIDRLNTYGKWLWRNVTEHAERKHATRQSSQ